MRISNKLYEEAIKKVFSAHAGDDNPDPEAVKEVQKAVTIFVKNILTYSQERSSERDKQGDRIYPEDLLYQFRDNPKYLDACAKTLYMFNYGSLYSKDFFKAKGATNLEPNEYDSFSSNDIERLQGEKN